MEIAFQGTFAHTIDQKGRLSIPATLREMLPKSQQKEFTVMRGLDGCLFLYPRREWERVQRKIKRLPFWKADTRRFARLFFQRAYNVKPDKQGRITIPQELLDETKFDKEVWFLGVGERIEIWNPKVYKKYMTDGNVTFEEAAEKVLVPREDASD